MIRTEDALDRELTTPSKVLVKFIGRTKGDFIVLGAGGKMGPSLVLLLQNAIRATNGSKRVYAVSRFTAKGLKERLDASGVETVVADLLDEEQLKSLPKASNVIDMVGQKFGTTGDESRTWAVNAYSAGRIAERFKDSRIVYFSTGNVYPLVSTERKGATERDVTGPIGEYSQSRLAAERIVEFFSRKHRTKAAILRLNYAIELRYGVLHDVAQTVISKKPLDLTMGYVNVIWQGDANEFAIRALKECSTPPMVLNITGPEKISIRWLAEEFGRIFNIKPLFKNSEEKAALLSDASTSIRIFGRPRVTLQQMILWVASWLKSGGHSLGKPTHFQERTGRF